MCFNVVYVLCVCVCVWDQLLCGVWLFWTPWTAACQASLSITNSRSLLKPMSIESVMPSIHLILCCPLLLPPSIFPNNYPDAGMRWLDGISDSMDKNDHYHVTTILPSATLLFRRTVFQGWGWESPLAHWGWSLDQLGIESLWQFAFPVATKTRVGWAHTKPRVHEFLVKVKGRWRNLHILTQQRQGENRVLGPSHLKFWIPSQWDL